MNGIYKNSELQSQGGIKQELSNDIMLIEQLEQMGVLKADCVCQKIVYSEIFFLTASLIFIATMLGILIILYFWGEVFFVRDQNASAAAAQSRRNSKEPVKASAR